MGPEPEFAHALILGGTGMLLDASIEIASRSREVTSVARTEASLDALDAMIDPAVVHHPVALDWDEPETYLNGIEDHIKETTSPDLVVAWIHDGDIARRLASVVTPGTFVHIIGSEHSNPTEIATRFHEACAPQERIE